MNQRWCPLGLAVALAGCKHPELRTELIDPGAPSSATASLTPSGAVADGVWSDTTYPWSIHVPPDWEVIAGMDGANPRLTLVHAGSRVRVEVSVHPNGGLGPHTRRGCEWAFTDVAGYRALAIPGLVTVGTCTPEDARHARVLGYYIAANGVAYDLEEVIPPGHLLDGKATADALLGGFRLRLSGK